MTKKDTQGQPLASTSLCTNMCACTHMCIYTCTMLPSLSFSKQKKKRSLRKSSQLLLNSQLSAGKHSSRQSLGPCWDSQQGESSQPFLTRVLLFSPRHFPKLEHLRFVTSGGRRSCWLPAGRGRDHTNTPTMHRGSLITYSCLVQNVNSSKVRKLIAQDLPLP